MDASNYGQAKDFSLVDHVASVTSIEVCYCSMKEVRDNTEMNKCGSVPRKLYLLKQKVDQIWRMAVVCHHLI